MKYENIIIPKENIAKIEEIREINTEMNSIVGDQIPSYEEFMKTYNESKEAVDSYENEFNSYEDLRVKGTYYGPGFWDEIKGFVKPVTSGILIAASVFPPTATIAAPVAFGIAGTGMALGGLGHITDNKELKEFGKDIAEIGMGARDGQGITESPMGMRQPSLNEYAQSKNRN